MSCVSIIFLVVVLIVFYRKSSEAINRNGCDELLTKSCFQTITGETGYNYQTGLSVCQDLDGRIARFVDEESWKYFESHISINVLPKKLWDNRVWFGLEKENNGWIWENGDSCDYDAWHAKEDEEEESCGSIGSHKDKTDPEWYSDVCSELKGVLCEFPASIDGSWGMWSPWSTHCLCNETSEEAYNGTKYRTRTCNNPPPQFGGLDCPSLPEEETFCYCEPSINKSLEDSGSTVATSVYTFEGILNSTSTTPKNESVPKKKVVEVKVQLIDVDKRPSAIVLGAVGIISMILFALFFLFLDMRTLSKQIKIMKRNLRRLSTSKTKIIKVLPYNATTAENKI